MYGHLLYIYVDQNLNVSLNDLFMLKTERNCFQKIQISEAINTRFYVFWDRNKSFQEMFTFFALKCVSPLKNPKFACVDSN